METSLFIYFVVLGISLAAPVGPIKMEMIRRGIGNGFWPSWLVGLGGMTADLIFLLCIFWGIAPFLQNRLIETIMFGFGITLLFYLGVSNIKKASTKGSIVQPKEHGGSSFLLGFAIAFINPFNLLFWFGIYTASLHRLPSSWPQQVIFLYSLGIIFGIFIWNINLAFLLHFCRSWVNEQVLRIVTFIAGCTLVIFSLLFLKDWLVLKG